MIQKMEIKCTWILFHVTNKKGDTKNMLEFIIAIVSYLLGASTVYILLKLNILIINNKVSVKGNQNQIINGCSNEKK